MHHSSKISRTKVPHDFVSFVSYFILCRGTKIIFHTLTITVIAKLQKDGISVSNNKLNSKLKHVIYTM